MDSFYCYNMLQHLNALKYRWSLTWQQYRWAIVNFYTCPRLTEEKCLQKHFWPSRFQTFLGGGGRGCMPPDPPSGAHLRRSKLVSSCSEVWLRPWKLSFVAAVKSSPVGRAYRNWMDSHRKYHREGLYFVFLFFFFFWYCVVLFLKVYWKAYLALFRPPD